MKNKIVPVSVLITILMFLINLTVFAQNQPEKKDTKASNQFTTTHVQQHGKTKTNQQAQNQNQKEMNNTNNKVTSDEQKDHASVSKDNQNKESVNTQYHKKQGTTTKEQQKQIKNPTKGGSIE